MNDNEDGKMHIVTSKGKNRWKRIICENKLLTFLISVIIIAITVGIFFGIFFVSNIIKKPTWNFRLPKTLLPKHYVLEIQPYLTPDDFRFEGNVKITFTCIQKTDLVILNAKNLTIEENSIRILDENNVDIHLLKMEYESELQLLIFHLLNDLQNGVNYILSMTFEGELDEDYEGLYLSTYPDKDNVTHYTAVTHFEPMSARKAFPCFDEPWMKATFDIILVRSKNLMSLSNMPKLKTESRGEYWEADIYETSMKMSTYLVSYFIGDYAGRSKNKTTIWVPKDNISSVEYALEFSPRVLEYFEHLLGVPYEAPKLDMISVNMLYSGMENWGLIMYGLGSLMYNETEKNLQHRKIIAHVITHETAHQWFGNLVTPKWWNDVWLSEGITTYMTTLAMRDLFPEWDKIDRTVRSLYSDDDCSNPDASPINKPIINSESEAFTNEAYVKGAFITRMAHRILGNETFWTGLSKYLKKYSYGNVEEKDFWEYLSKEHNSKSDFYLNMTEIMTPWTHLKGQPILTVTRDYNYQTAFLEQISCRVMKQSEGENDLWNIPIFYTTSEERNPKIDIWMTTKNMTIFGMPKDDRWLLINGQSVGCYLVNYDRHNWNLLAKQLQRNHSVFEPDERGKILNDVSVLNRLNYTTSDTVLDIYLYLSKEKELEVLLFQSLIREYSDIVKYSGIESIWNEFLKYILIPIYGRLGWAFDKNIDLYHVRIIRRGVLTMLCKTEYEPCVKIALKKFQTWKNQKYNDTIIDDEIKYLVFCTGIKYGTSKDWEELLKKNLEDALDENKALALACSRNQTLIKKLLELLLIQPKLESMRISIISEIIANREMWLEVFKFIDGNLEKLIKEKQIIIKLFKLITHTTLNPIIIDQILATGKNIVGQLNKSEAESLGKLLTEKDKSLLEINWNLEHILHWSRNRPWEKV